MRTKVALLVTALSLGVFIAVLVHAVWYAPEIEVSELPNNATTQTAPTSTVTTADVQGYPARLSIPKLHIDAAVQKVGIAKSGNLAVPSNFTDVAWYKGGAVPGNAGTAVFDGHVDNGLSLAGVFKHLSEITKGDDIVITTVSGTELRYVVSDIELYPYQSVPMSDIVSKTGDPRLVLITCDGAWVQGQRTYDHRLVVYATLVT